MMVIWMMIRMLLGMWLRIRLTDTLDAAHTAVSASDMIRAGATLVVTASAEQTPNTWSVMGLLSTIGSRKTSRFLLMTGHPRFSGAPGTARKPLRPASNGSCW